MEGKARDPPTHTHTLIDRIKQVRSSKWEVEGRKEEVGKDPPVLDLAFTG